MTDHDVPSQVAPHIAPLALPLWETLLAARTPRVTTLARPDAATQAAAHAAQAAAHAHILPLLHAELATARQLVTAQVDAVRAGAAVRVGDVLGLLGRDDQGEALASRRARVARWRASGVLWPPHARQHLEAASVVALLLVRALLADRARLHLPQIPADESRWWCWRQDAPDAAPVPCPVPLPADLPAAARLWTPWTGAAWDATWHAVPGGAARWGGAITVGDLTRWASPARLALTSLSAPTDAVLLALGAHPVTHEDVTAPRAKAPGLQGDAAPSHTVRD